MIKLQIEGQRLRVRVGEEQLQRLLAGETLETRTRFAQAFALQCTLRLAAGDEARFSGSAGAWRIELPAQAVRAHAARLPSRDGLTFVLPAGGGDALELLFDVDVRDSVRKRHGA